MGENKILIWKAQEGRSGGRWRDLPARYGNWNSTNGKFPVVATSSVTSHGEFVKLVKENFGKVEPKPRFIILFDSDEAGRTNSQKLYNKLLSAQFPVVRSFLSEEVSKIDANDILREQGEDKLGELINSILNVAQENLKKLADNIEEEVAFPGCEYQTALVLNGPQKIGKSTMAKFLGGQ